MIKYYPSIIEMQFLYILNVGTAHASGEHAIGQRLHQCVEQTRRPRQKGHWDSSLVVTLWEHYPLSWGRPIISFFWPNKGLILWTNRRPPYPPLHPRPAPMSLAPEAGCQYSPVSIRPLKQWSRHFSPPKPSPLLLISTVCNLSPFPPQ